MEKKQKKTKLPDLESQNLQSLIVTLTWTDVPPGNID